LPHYLPTPLPPIITITIEFDPDLGICTQQMLFDKFYRFANWGVGAERVKQMQQVIFALRGGNHIAVTDFLDVMLSSFDH